MAGRLGNILINLGVKADDRAIGNIIKDLEVAGKEAEQVGRRLQNVGEKVSAALNTGPMAFTKRLRSVGQSMQTIGTQASAAITLPVLGAGLAIAKIAGDFDAQMRVVQAVAGATSQELAAMREKAIQLGTDTQFSASEAAAGMIEFSKAGLSAGQVMDAIAPALNFAAASGLELGRVAEITANSMSQFGLEASEASYIADVFTRAADASTTGVEDLSQAMAEAAPFARLVGADIKETMTILGAFANAGIQGSKAGTALKNGFISLSAPTPKAVAALQSVGIAVSDFMDAQGNMKVPFTDLLKQLSTAQLSIEQGVAIFGRESAGAMLSIINDFQKVEKVAASMQGLQGNAAQQAAIKMQGFNGAVKGLQSALEGLAIRIADSGVLEFFEKVVNQVSVWVKTLANLNPALLKWVAIIAGAAAGLAALVAVVGTAILAFTTAAGAAATMWASISLPALAIAAGIAIVIAGIIALVDDFFAYIDGRPSLIGSWIDKFTRDYPELKKLLQTLWSWVSEKSAGLWGDVKLWAEWAFSSIKGIIEGGGRMVEMLFSLMGKALPAAEKIAGNINRGGTGAAAPALASGVQTLSSPMLPGALNAGLTDARSTTRNSVANSLSQVINAPISVNVTGGPGGASPRDIAQEVQKVINNFVQPAAHSARPVFAQ